MSYQPPTEGFDAGPVDFTTQNCEETPLAVSGAATAATPTYANQVVAVPVKGAQGADGDIYTIRFWRRVLDAAIKTFAATLATLLGVPAVVDATASSAAVNVPWQAALGGAFVVTLINVLLNIGGRGFGNTADPSWIDTK